MCGLTPGSVILKGYLPWLRKKHTLSIRSVKAGGILFIGGLHLPLGTQNSEEYFQFCSKFAAQQRSIQVIICVDYRGYCLPGKVEEMLEGKTTTEDATWNFLWGCSNI